MVNQCFLRLASPALIPQQTDTAVSTEQPHHTVLELYPGYILITVCQQVLLASTMKAAASEGDFPTEAWHFDGGLAVSASDDFGKAW